MGKYAQSFIAFIGKFPIVKHYTSKRKRLLISATSIEAGEQDENNWGKSAAYLPETGECYLSISLYQFEEERRKVSAFA
jgi:hypothetical protein